VAEGEEAAAPALPHARRLEEKVFSEYVARVAEAKPDAPVPPLFEDQPLFENAQALRQELGEDAFFKKLLDCRGSESRPCLLNLDGYEVVAHDKAGRQVRLNLKLLEELFGGAQ
jgi:hypothetical protein